VGAAHETVANKSDFQGFHKVIACENRNRFADGEASPKKAGGFKVGNNQEDMVLLETRRLQQRTDSVIS
jgi:hypothetical protein